MLKFHINKKGVPAVCKAKENNCPLGDNAQHFKTIEDAQLAADNLNKEKYGLLSSINNDFTASLFPHSEGLLEVLETEFPEYAFVAEVKTDDPMEYSLDSIDNFALSPYIYKARTLNNPAKILNEKGEFNQEFRDALGEYLKNNEGPVKHLLGTKMKQVLDPNKASNFIYQYANEL